MSRDGAAANHASRISSSTRRRGRAQATARARWRRSTSAPPPRWRRRRTARRGRRGPCWRRSTRRCRSSSTRPPARRGRRRRRARRPRRPTPSRRARRRRARRAASGSWPRARNCSTTASATPVRSSAATAILIERQGIVTPMVEERALEQELFAVGERLAAAMPTPSRNPFKLADEKAMELASQDGELKAALFRFVDVVPACRSLDDLARHLTGFLGEVEQPTPPISAAMRMGNNRAGRTALGAAAARGVKHMAHRFIVGESPRDALGVFRDLWKDGVASSVDLLGEATVTQAEAQRYAERCDEALETLVEAMRGWPERAAPRARLVRRAPARQPLGQGLRAHAADAPGRPRARPARRRPAAARAAAPGAPARRAPAHRHGVDGLARRGARADPRAARRGGVPGRPVGRRRAPGLPARLAADARHDRRVDRRRGRRGARSR